MTRFLVLAVGLAVLVTGSARAQPKATEEQMKRWAAKVGELKPAEQEAAFRAKMGELNPKLDPNGVKVVADKDGVVRELVIPATYVEDICPVALFHSLEKLDALTIAGSRSKLADVSCLRGLAQLKDLRIGYTAVADISPLTELPLEKLYLGGTQVKDVRILKKMPLTEVELPNGISAKQLDVLTGKPLTVFVTFGPGPDSAKEAKAIFGNAKLETYRVAKSNLESLDPFAGMPLKILLLGEAPKLKSLAPLKGCTTLRTLNFTHAPLVTDLAPVAKKELLNLEFPHCPGIRDLAPLKSAPELTYLNITSSGVTDLAPVAGLRNLDTLWVEEMQVKSLKPIAGLPNVRAAYLRKLVVMDRDLTPITKLPALTRLDIEVTPVTAPLLKKITTLKELNGALVAVPPK